MGLCGSKTEESSTAKVTSRHQDRRKESALEHPAKQNSYVTSSNSEDTRVDKAGLPPTTGGKSEKTSKDEEVKVLLLGAGESGKSTIIQQLKILHQNGFTHDELLEYRSVVFKNILDIGKELVEARSKFNVPLESDSGLSADDLERFYAFDHNDQQKNDVENSKFKSEGEGVRNDPAKQTDQSEVKTDEKEEDLKTGKLNLSSLTQLPPDLPTTLLKLWNLESTKALLNDNRRSEFYLMDSASYFIDNLERISKENYIPNEQDVLRSRQKTSGIFDNVFDVGSNLKLHMYDVGGQRSERKKWIHCFDNVTVIIFCVSLPEYDQLLLEDQGQNRFQESLVLFDNVINSRWFARTSVVLFLNKIDLFAEKIQKVPLETYFPDYTGGQDINKAAKYILWRFVQLNRANLNIYPHVTQATDTSNIKLVFAAIKETILENTLKDSGVL